jgi:hypothetical protein
LAYVEAAFGNSDIFLSLVMQDANVVGHSHVSVTELQRLAAERRQQRRESLSINEQPTVSALHVPP